VAALFWRWQLCSASTDDTAARGDANGRGRRDGCLPVCGGRFAGGVKDGPGVVVSTSRAVLFGGRMGLLEAARPARAMASASTVTNPCFKHRLLDACLGQSQAVTISGLKKQALHLRR
jgi:hypothetical protein